MGIFQVAKQVVDYRILVVIELKAVCCTGALGITMQAPVPRRTLATVAVRDPVFKLKVCTNYGACNSYVHIFFALLVLFVTHVWTYKPI